MSNNQLNPIHGSTPRAGDLTCDEEKKGESSTSKDSSLNDSGWSRKRGTEITSVITKGASPRWQGFNYQSHGVLFITSENVRDGSLDVSNPKFLPEEFGRKLKNSRLQYGDILINIVGASIGRSCKYTLTDYEANINQAVCLFRLRNDICADFIAFYLQAPSTVRRLLSNRVDSARPNLSLSDFRDFEFLLPPLSEQHKITDILRTWDEAIENVSRLVQVSKRQHEALTFQLVFGQRRLANFASSNDREEYRWFSLPADWTVKPVGQLAEEVSDRNGDVFITEVLSCSKYDGFVRSLEYFKKQVYSSDLSGYKQIRRGDFGFPSNHVEEGSIGLQNLVDIGIVSPIYTVFRFDPEMVDNDYAFSVLKTSTYKHIFEVSTSASVDRRGSLRWKEFAKIPFPVPPLAEQRAISAFLAEYRGLIERLEAEKAALARQKRGLMQKLLTGEWRVKAEV